MVAGGIAVALLLGTTQPVLAADKVTFTDAQLGQELFAAAVRMKHSGLDFDKAVMGSAELLDWRTKNPTATASAVAGHVTMVAQSMNTAFTAVDSQRKGTERLGRLLEIVQTTPQAEIGGTWLERVLAVLTARDLPPATVTSYVTQRLSGAQQRNAADVPYSIVSSDIWRDLSARSQTDIALNDAWKGQYGTVTPAHPDGLSPNWTVSRLKAFGELKNLVNVDAIVTAGKIGKPVLYDELQKQYKRLRTKLDEHNALTRQKISQAATTAPGAPNNGPSQGQVDDQTKYETAQQAWIDTIKGGLDLGVGIVRLFDPGLARHMAGYVETAYKVATALNRAFTAVVTLATTTAVGAGFIPVVGAIAGAAVGLIQVFSGLLSGGDDTQEMQQAIIKEIRNGVIEIRLDLEKLYNTMNARFDRIEKGLEQIYRTMISGFNEVITELAKANRKLDTIQEHLLRLSMDMQGFLVHQLLAVRDSDGKEFFSAANTYVDYLPIKHTPLPAYDGPAPSFTNATDRYSEAATLTARHAAYVFTNPGEQNLDLAFVNGPPGAINYMLNREGMPSPDPEGKVGNADLWAEAARAQVITSMQNVSFAARQGSTRIDQIIKNGEYILQAGQKLSAPTQNPDSATNSAFTNRLTAVRTRTQALVNALPQLYQSDEIMPPDRKYDLWSGVYQQNLDVDKLPAPLDVVENCDGLSSNVQRSGFLTGRNLPKAQTFGLYVDPANWQYRPCWTNPHWDGPPTNVIMDRQGEKYTLGRVVFHNADFAERVRPNPHAPYETARVVRGTRQIVLCQWESIDDPS